MMKIKRDNKNLSWDTQYMGRSQIKSRLPGDTRIIKCPEGNIIPREYEEDKKIVPCSSVLFLLLISSENEVFLYY